MALRRIELMYFTFGKCEGHACRECSNLVKYDYHNKPYCKCKVYGITRSSASDWVQRWQACGMFNKPWDDKKIVRLVRPTKKEKEEMQAAPLEGQISMEV